MIRSTVSRVLGVYGISAVLAASSLVFVSLCAAQSAWRPDKPVEIVVTAAPGGGNDKNARLMQKIWQDSKLIETSIVQNKPGGGGALAYTFTSQGDANRIVIARTGLVTNHILGVSTLNYTDLTPLALLGFQSMSLAVRADSPIKSVKDLVERWKKDPQSVSISLGGSLGSATHFVVARIAKAAGVDPKKLKVLIFSGANDGMIALLGGHIDMVATTLPAEQYQAGKVRVIGIATEKRSTILPDIPTMKEQGYDVVVPSWTAIMGPKGLSAAQVAFWEGALERIANSEVWRRSLTDESVEPAFMKSQATREYIAKDYEMSRAVPLIWAC